MIKSFLKNILPEGWILFYHKILSYLAAFFYRQPSKKLIVIGVTGTGGKSTVVNLIGLILEKAGYKVGWTTTFNFKIGGKTWLNKTKMTMLGRFTLQRMLARMVEAGCRYAIVETTSQGIRQFRHLGINYDIAVLTNLSPEHIEAHQGFENYKRAKGQLFAGLSKYKRKTIKGRIIDKVSIINLDDKNKDYFLSFSADQKIGYGVNNDYPLSDNLQIIRGKEIKAEPDGVSFIVEGKQIHLNLLGQFNIYNSLAAISVALSQGINVDLCQQALNEVQRIPGRMEIINRQPLVIVDYAHTPDSLERVYQDLKKNKPALGKIICLLGAAGGGRDKWKRPQLGRLASDYCDYVIVTNEDPYWEDPEQIIKEVASGVIKEKIHSLYKIIDRREAIEKALTLAGNDDVVIITGKGCEQCIMSRGKKIPWDDREIVKQILKLCQKKTVENWG